MSRTKEEMAKILAKKHTRKMLNESVWADLVTAIQGVGVEERLKLVKMLVNGETKLAGKMLMDLLHQNAKSRAQDYVDSILADDTLSLTELDSLL